MAGKLTYKDFYETDTEIEFTKGVLPDVEFCGTGDPLRVKWTGDRYGTYKPSSATIHLWIETLEQRAFIEDVFNGGWEVSVYKDKNPFWFGKITPTLGIESYRAYPYELVLNCNDGMGDLKRKQFLMTDWPDPWTEATNTTSVLDVLIKIIDKHLYPNGSFTIHSYLDSYAFVQGNGIISDIYLDPLVFMEQDEDYYIALDKVIESLLGPLNLQLFQWKGDWWVMDLNAQWDNGTVRYYTWNVQDGVPAFQGISTDTLGIFDLYSCDPDNIEIGNSGNIDFIQPWLIAEIKQQFQLNNCILPVFANRTGNFYHGHEVEGEFGLMTFQDLEFKFDDKFNVPSNLKHWNDLGLIVNQWPTNKLTNTGYAWVDTVQSELYVSRSVWCERTVDPNLTFDQFFWSISVMPTFNDKMVSTDQVLSPTLYLLIKYTDTVGNYWYYWMNNDADPNFAGWGKQGEIRQFLVTDYNISIQGSMPDTSAFTGGTFEFAIQHAVDPNSWNGYGILINRLQFGINTVLIQNLPVQETGYKLTDEDKRQLISLGLDFTNLIFVAWYLADKGLNKLKENRKVIGGKPVNSYQSSEVLWEDTASITINPNAQAKQTFEYIWGLAIPGLIGYHDYHLSSPYFLNGDPMEAWVRDSIPNVEKNLIGWKINDFVRDNQKYTTQLSGRYRAPIISPLQLINDYEGRVYQWLNGTYHDKSAQWNCTFMEFKGAKIPGQPTLGDFIPDMFNNDFSTLIPA